MIVIVIVIVLLFLDYYNRYCSLLVINANMFDY